MFGPSPRASRRTAPRRAARRIRWYISERGKIDPRRKSGCAKHQRMLTTELKRARQMALLPYTAEHVRSLMSPQARAMAGGPPPPKPERPPYRPGGYQAC